MREINVNKIKNLVARLCIEANINLRPDIYRALRRAVKREKKKSAKRLLEVLVKNAEIARREARPICQDTGIVSVYVRMGQKVRLVGGDLVQAINKGVAEGYKKGLLRKSVVKSPLLRVNTCTNAPAIIYTEVVKGSGLELTVIPKGFGSENKGAVRMLNPTEGEREIISFVLEVVKAAGPDACPPYIIGVGLGGTLDKAASLAKEALAAPLERSSTKRYLRRLERNLLDKVNKLGVGPMGLGGRATALGVKVLEYPTHIAGLPVAVNVGCHATRSARRAL